jgi:hypothetical protein
VASAYHEAPQRAEDTSGWGSERRSFANSKRVQRVGYPGCKEGGVKKPSDANERSKRVRGLGKAWLEWRVRDREPRQG